MPCPPNPSDRPTRSNERKGRAEWSFTDLTPSCALAYRFDGADPAARRDAGAAPTWHPRPALSMPRAASRILLEVMDVCVERLLDIGPADAIAEGVPRATRDPVPAYRDVWEGINGAGSWDENPWVAVVEFRRRNTNPCQR